MFNGIWLVAVEPLTIQGREIRAGERFHISRVHSGALLVTGKATIAHPQPPPKSREVAPPEPPPSTRRRGRQRKADTPDTVTDPAVPEVPATPDTSPVPETETPDVVEPSSNESIDVPRRRYQRRDLEADA